MIPNYSLYIFGGIAISMLAWSGLLFLYCWREGGHVPNLTNFLDFAGQFIGSGLNNANSVITGLSNATTSSMRYMTIPRSG